MMLPPLTSKINTTATLCPSLYVTDLSAETEALALHTTTKYVTISFTSLDKPAGECIDGRKDSKKTYVEALKTGMA